ncbi:hypothetical protein RN001_003810 [Aquatica leii]|uniref:Uncharacterized protein n=1 Tax=Aquatica leii TaxID=1421715 RepID=A0AAN7Q6N6_9COLE|nr:hypothetical protein RN001_003810 [Aquatica leii]
MNEYQEVRTQNRGVNITSDDFEPNEEDETIQQDTTGSRLQTDIQNMIDVIETSTPHFLYTSSSVDGDNEESLISSTSIVSSVVKVKQMGINKDSSVTNNCQSEISGYHSNETYGVIPECHYDSTQPLCIPAVLPPAVLCMNPHCVCTHSKGFVQHIPMHQHMDEKHTCNKKDKNGEKKYKLSAIFERITGNGKEKHATIPLDMYKMNVTQLKNDSNVPKRFVFDLIEGASKPDLHTTGTNTKMLSPKKMRYTHEPLKKFSSKKCNCPHGSRSAQYTGMVVTHQAPEEQMRLTRSLSRNVDPKNKTKKDNSTRVDVYYFDHGNAA